MVSRFLSTLVENKDLPRFLRGEKGLKRGKKASVPERCITEHIKTWSIKPQKRSPSHSRLSFTHEVRRACRTNPGMTKVENKTVRLDVERKNWDFAGESMGLPTYWFSVGGERQQRACARQPFVHADQEREREREREDNRRIRGGNTSARARPIHTAALVVPRGSCHRVAASESSLPLGTRQAGTCFSKPTRAPSFLRAHIHTHTSLAYVTRPHI